MVMGIGVLVLGRGTKRRGEGGGVVVVVEVEVVVVKGEVNRIFGRGIFGVDRVAIVEGLVAVVVLGVERKSKGGKGLAANQSSSAVAAAVLRTGGRFRVPSSPRISKSEADRGSSPFGVSMSAVKQGMSNNSEPVSRYERSHERFFLSKSFNV